MGRFAPVTAANPLSFWSQIDIPNPLYLFKLEGDRRIDTKKPTHRSPTIGKLLQPTAHLPVSHHFTPFIVTYTKVPSYEFIKMKVDYLYFTRTERFNPRKTSDASPRTKWVRPSHIASSKLRIFHGLRVANEGPQFLNTDTSPQ